MGDANPIRTLGDYSRPSHEGYRNTIKLPEGKMCRIHLHMGGSYYSFPCSIISTGKDRKTPQRYPDVPTTSRRISLISMDLFQGLTPKSPSLWHRPLAPTYIAPMQPTQVNKITSSCEICSGLHDTQYCMENPEQAFVDYASSRINETGSRQFAMNQGPRSFNEAANA
ncbi:hypothetical protein Tco_1441605 [Tanacetum coccineum]